MTIVYPLSLLPDFPGWTSEFAPVFRQEQSRTASGATIGKDLGSPLWRGTWTSVELSANDLDYWRARLESLEGVLKTFRAFSFSRCRPIRHPGASSLPTGSLDTISAGRNAISVTGLVNIQLSVGDLLQVGTADLHRVMEPAAGSPSSIFEVRPRIWPGVVTGAAVSITRPSCLMSLVSGSISIAADPRSGRGTITFQGLEAR